MIHPMAKAILLKHVGTKDTRKIWTEWLEHYDKSMTAVIKSQQVSTYLTSFRLANAAWRGTHENFLLHWKDTARLYNDISEEKHTDGQFVQFLNTALTGIDHLSQVKTNYDTSRRAAGGTAATMAKITFDEYVTLLVSQAQVYDAGNKVTKNPRANRQVNMSERIFDDDENPNDQIEVDVHDTETTIDQLIVMQNEGTRFGGTRPNDRPRKVMMNHKTWKSLSQDSQSAWDRISDKDKEAILLHASERAARSTPSNDPNLRINNHDLIFEDDDDDDETPKIKVKMHEIKEI